jgi:RNA polymerase sigma-70 factor, ECF subfamily
MYIYIMMKEQNDNVELDDLIRREPAAIEKWFRCYADIVFTFVYYKVGRDSELACDIVQDTFLEGISKISRYDSNRANMAGWLILLSRNFIKKALQHRKKFIPNSVLIQPDSNFLEQCGKLSSEKLPDEIIDNSEMEETVRVTLANIPLNYAEALKVRYYQGKTTAQISALLNISESAVKVLLHRARKSFEKAFIKLDGSC